MNSRYMRNILRIGSVVTLTLLVAAALSCSNPLSESEQIKEEFLEEDTADITIEFSDGENASAVTKDLHLPNKINGTSVTWSSSNPSVIQNNGTVHRPAFDAEDKTVTLTAILDYDGTTKTKSFEVRVERLYKVTYETYHSQINGDLPVPQGADSYNIITLNDVSSLISRDGFNYVGWTTVPESSSPEFNPAEEIVLSGDLTLYPCWSEGSYNVVYDGNDGEYVGTATDVPASSTEEYNSEITVASQGSMARPGYTFAGWNTKEDGTGDHYDPEDSQGNAFTIPAQNTTLYAQWTPIEYSIAYELNGGSNVAGNPNSYTIENLPIMLEDASKTDFLFDGWVDGEDIPTNKIPIGSTMNVVLKAQWSQESVTFESVVQTGGTSGTSNSTGLILTFDVDPATLVADDITVTGASKGALTGSGTTRSLAISDIGVGDGEMVSVAITNPSGYLVSGSPKSAVVYKDTREAVTFESVVQTGGISGTKDSTALTLTFDVDPTTLVANNITVTGATNVALSVNGTTRTLLISGITVANGEMVSVAIADPSGYSISGSPRSAVVYKDTREAVTFESAVQIGGTSGIVDTTGLELSFDVDPSTLTADDITVNGATKGALSDNGATRSLAISDITVGDGETVSVAITNPSGYSISGSPKSAVVYKDTREAVTFESAVQIGGTSGTSDTTGLELSFDVDPATLAADDIVVTGATEGGLTGSGTNRNLAISDITVGDGETVSVAITNPSGYVINGSPRSAVVYKDTRTAVTFENAVQTGGTSDISDSTGLTLSFNIDPSTLAADNITVTGATKGALTGSGTTRNLAISDITVANGKTVTVAITNPSGYLISGSPQTAVVYKTPIPVTFQSAVQTGGTSDISDSTGLTLSFNIDPSTLAADNITVTGATRGALTGSGTTRNLAISDITVANGETVSVAITNPLGYLISGSPQTAVVYKAPIPVTFQSAVQTGGTSDISDSTGLTLSFDAEPSTLAADNITVTGATKGALTGSGTT
ncbi:MAG: InlB B-repeat-containing protein [Spirochaetia bacterium]|nr:InlB B-repeat-containing protein [Spirochaetia bacterium]